MSILLWTVRQRGNHLLVVFFCPLRLLLFPWFNSFLHLLHLLHTQFLPIIRLFLSLRLSVRPWQCVHVTESNIRCTERNQTDRFLYGDLLTAERQKLFFFFSTPLAVAINIHLTHTQMRTIHTGAHMTSQLQRNASMLSTTCPERCTAVLQCH